MYVSLIDRHLPRFQHLLITVSDSHTAPLFRPLLRQVEAPISLRHGRTCPLAHRLVNQHIRREHRGEIRWYIFLCRGDVWGVPGCYRLVCARTWALRMALTYGVYRLGNNLAGQYKRAVGMALHIGIGNFSGAISSNVYRTQDAPRYIIGRTSST